MEEKIKKIDELIVTANGRFHKKKLVLFAEVRGILEKYGEKQALSYINEMQKRIGVRADVSTYEQMEAITALKKILK